jgi:hypothetical protein
LPSKFWQTLRDALIEGFFCFCKKKKTMTTWDGEMLELLLPAYRLEGYLDSFE